mgnify:FL=1
MRRLTTVTSKLAYIYLMTALVTPALVPMGYMIGRNSTSNLVEIRLCSSVARQQTSHVQHAGQVQHHSENPGHLSQPTGEHEPEHQNVGTADLCPFGLASAALLLGNAASDERTRFYRSSEILAPLVNSVVDHTLPPLPARGPPVLV